MRDIFLQLAADDIFRTKLTAGLHRGWIDATLRNEPCRDRAVFERARDPMNRATRDGLIAGYETPIPGLDLPEAAIAPSGMHADDMGVVGLATGERGGPLRQGARRPAA